MRRKVFGLVLLVGICLLGFVLVGGCSSTTTDATTTTTAAATTTTAAATTTTAAGATTTAAATTTTAAATTTTTSATTTTAGSSTLTIKNSSSFAGDGAAAQSISAIGAQAVPEDLELNVTFASFGLSNEAGSTTTIFTGPVVLDLLSGTLTVSLETLDPGTYTSAVMFVTAISLESESRGETLDMLGPMEYSGENFSPAVMPMPPITITNQSPDFTMYFYMPAENLVGGPSLDTIQFTNGPTLTIIAENYEEYVSTEEAEENNIATVNVSINGINSANSNVFCGFYSNLEEETIPLYADQLDNNGDGTATKTFYIPAGSYIGMAFETDGDGSSGPGDNDSIFTGSQFNAVAGETTEYSMEGAQAALEVGVPVGSAVITFEVQPGSAITLESTTKLYSGLMTSLPGQGGDSTPTRILFYELDPGLVTTSTRQFTDLGDGTYYLAVLLDVDDDFDVSVGDYFAMYGGFENSIPITISDEVGVDITASPLTLVPYSDDLFQEQQD